MERDEKSLLDAALEGDIEAVRDLLDKNPDLINARDSEGADPVMRAAGGHLDIIKLLVERGADLETVGQDGTALHMAAWYDQREIAQYLLDQGMDVNARSRSGETALMAAAYKGFTDTGRALIAAGAEVNCQTTQGTTDMFMTSPPVVGETPLHLAAAYGHRDFVELLLAHGADKEVTDHAGQKPLHWAARHKRNELFELLG